VINSNGSEVATGNLTRPATNELHKYTIDATTSRVRFWIDDQIAGELTVPVGRPSPTSAISCPLHFRQYNSAASSAAFKLSVGRVSVSSSGMLANVPPHWNAIASGGSGYVTQSGVAVGQTASYVNNTNPTAAAGSNTAALVTGLGGHAWLTAPAAAATDRILTSYQNPLGSASYAGKTLMVTGCRIEACNLGAAVATTPTTYLISVAFGHTAVSLATADAVNAHAPRRAVLGFVSFPVGAAVGQPADKAIEVQFDNPIPVNPGEFIAATARCMAGTATASQVSAFAVHFNASWI